MAKDNLQVEAQGTLVHGSGKHRPLCPSCVAARHTLALMYQRPAGWGHYQRTEGMRVLDIEADPSVLDAEKEWLRSFRAQVPSFLGPTEVIVFVTKRRGEEQEVVVPHERLAALAILASSPSSIKCFCGQDCSPIAAVVAPNQQGELGLYCSPLCHMVHTNPEALTVTIAIFGARPKSEVWDGDSGFTRLGETDEAEDAEDAKDANWNGELAELHARHEEFGKSGKRELYGLYTRSGGKLTLKMIAEEVGTSESTVSRWFTSLRE